MVVSGRIGKGLAAVRTLMPRAHTSEFEEAGCAMEAFEALHHDIIGPFRISFHLVSPAGMAAGTVNFGGVASFVGAGDLLGLLLALFVVGLSDGR